MDYAERRPASSSKRRLCIFLRGQFTLSDNSAIVFFGTNLRFESGQSAIRDHDGSTSQKIVTIHGNVRHKVNNSIKSINSHWPWFIQFGIFLFFTRYFRMREVGVIKRFRKIWELSLPKCSLNSYTITVGFEYTAPLFLFLAISITISFTVLICEIIHFQFKKCRGVREHWIILCGISFIMIKSGAVKTNRYRLNNYC